MTNTNFTQLVFIKNTDPTVKLNAYYCSDYRERAPHDLVYTWKIKGNENPFPVKNECSFVGFEPTVMEKYFEAAGYKLIETNIDAFTLNDALYNRLP